MHAAVEPLIDALALDEMRRREARLAELKVELERREIELVNEFLDCKYENRDGRELPSEPKRLRRLALSWLV